ncbi:4,5-DOPA dioxygenase extradiol [Wickerhamomyces ciferrii]|uniref:4,5-DOPA dioxygenase extradiol n=1 Tax=Wickerhamomyces ciferrii (strain ATCC 14091 / BCRC 22168 / CBS 111 / JCM 3599 / NBRC 0793 / NRRL Y-1031 F-60-10) TaxID=1206466 RepID=K0KIX5_WICCF|nr:4,5-DOPA dioxygenase extradiol [Wickerhamomyces ciferrii]CCH42931.1 4,5-DOPA dioxygenase extradiol [Wickerhamomyces ciferrii]
MPSVTTLFDQTKPKTPVFFFSHGGPTFMYPDEEFGSDKGAYKTVKKLGHYIINVIKPKFIIVISAHWESNSFNSGVDIGIPGSQSSLSKNSKKLDKDEIDLIYDFGGFPDYMYEEQFHSKGNLELANDIKTTLANNKIDSKLTKRGLDHGVWVPFKVAFSSNKPKDQEWDLEMPLVQISLPGTDDFNTNYELGKALSKYRELGGVIICSGMSVHNLRDFRAAMGKGSSSPMPYVKPFSEKVKSIVTEYNGVERLNKFNELVQNDKKLLYDAHPSLEHFMPIVVASGAGDEELAKQVYDNHVKSLAWGIYQFGEYKE